MPPIQEHHSTHADGDGDYDAKEHQVASSSSPTASIGRTLSRRHSTSYGVSHPSSASRRGETSTLDDASYPRPSRRSLLMRPPSRETKHGNFTSRTTVGQMHEAAKTRSMARRSSMLPRIATEQVSTKEIERRISTIRLDRRMSLNLTIGEDQENQHPRDGGDAGPLSSLERTIANPHPPHHPPKPNSTRRSSTNQVLFSTEPDQWVKDDARVPQTSTVTNRASMKRSTSLQAATNKVKRDRFLSMKIKSGTSLDLPEVPRGQYPPLEDEDFWELSTNQPMIIAGRFSEPGCKTHTVDSLVDVGQDDHDRPGAERDHRPPVDLDPQPRRFTITGLDFSDSYVNENNLLKAHIASRAPPLMATIRENVGRRSSEIATSQHPSVDRSVLTRASRRLLMITRVRHPGAVGQQKETTGGPRVKNMGTHFNHNVKGLRMKVTALKRAKDHSLERTRQYASVIQDDSMKDTARLPRKTRQPVEHDRQVILEKYHPESYKNCTVVKEHIQRHRLGQRISTTLRKLLIERDREFVSRSRKEQIAALRMWRASDPSFANYIARWFSTKKIQAAVRAYMTKRSSRSTWRAYKTDVVFQREQFKLYIRTYDGSKADLLLTPHQVVNFSVARLAHAIHKDRRPKIMQITDPHIIAAFDLSV